MMRARLPCYTPDGRYLVVLGARGPRLWRATNPNLKPEVRQALTSELMSARKAVRTAKAEEEVAAARARVDAAKIRLGERGPVWWSDGAPDLNRRLVAHTGYADWWSGIEAAAGSAATTRDNIGVKST